MNGPKRLSLYADTDTHELIELKEMDHNSHIVRYYELFTYEDYNGDFIELWDTDNHGTVRVVYSEMVDVIKTRKRIEKEKGCKLLSLKSVMIPFIFYKHYFA